jgi:trehalose 6-phosphate phosphatase
MNTQTSSAPHWKSATDAFFAPILACDRLGLITDMDGTISHIAETPEAAVVTPRNRQLLGTMVLILPLVAAVSGRSARDLQARVAVPGVVYVGNHGLERWENGGRTINENVRQYRKSLAAALDELRPKLTVGMWIEDKYATASIHYRLTPNPEKAAQELDPFIQEVVNRYGLKVNAGRRLFEIRPPIDANKGTAVEDLVNEYALDAVIYIGDDLTDVDAMQKAQELRAQDQCKAVTIGVIPTSTENDTEIEKSVRAVSDVLAKDVTDVEAFLSWLLAKISNS